MLVTQTIGEAIAAGSPALEIDVDILASLLVHLRSFRITPTVSE